MTKETLTINGKQYNRITEGKINSKFIKYRIYDKIADEINNVEPDDFNLRKFELLKRKLISFSSWLNISTGDSIFDSWEALDSWQEVCNKYM